MSWFCCDATYRNQLHVAGVAVPLGLKAEMKHCVNSWLSKRFSGVASNSLLTLAGPIGWVPLTTPAIRLTNPVFFGKIINICLWELNDFNSVEIAGKDLLQLPVIFSLYHNMIQRCVHGNFSHSNISLAENVQCYSLCCCCEKLKWMTWYLLTMIFSWFTSGNNSSFDLTACQWNGTYNLKVRWPCGPLWGMTMGPLIDHMINLDIILSLPRLSKHVLSAVSHPSPKSRV